MRAPETPKYALVLWPDATDKVTPSCIDIWAVPQARQRGAVLIAAEDMEMMPAFTNRPRFDADRNA